jgi:hypothetical protein
MQWATRVTVAVPSFNQGRYLNQVLASLFQHDVPVDAYLADGDFSGDSLE